MADGGTRRGEHRARPEVRAVTSRIRAALASAASLVVSPCAAAEPGASAAELLASAHLDPHNAMGVSVLMGLVIFATTTALLHLRERGRWTRRERALSAEIEELRGAQDRAEMLVGAERQLIVTWRGRDAEPQFEGDASFLGEPGQPRRALAFGSWLVAADAAALEGALEKLRGRGEPFRSTLRTLQKGFVEADGRTVGGR